MRLKWKARSVLNDADFIADAGVTEQTWKHVGRLGVASRQVE